MGPDFAFKNQVREGDVLIADDNFTCLEKNQEVVVQAGSEGHLHVACSEGTHDLESQLDDEDRYVGLSLKRSRFE